MIKVTYIIDLLDSQTESLIRNHTRVHTALILTLTHSLTHTKLHNIMHTHNYTFIHTQNIQYSTVGPKKALFHCSCILLA